MRVPPISRWPLVVALVLVAMGWPAPSLAQNNGPFVLSSNGQCTPAFSISNLASLAIQINGSGTWEAVPAGSIDGVIYKELVVVDTSDTTPSPVGTLSAAGQWIGSVGGLRSARVCLTSYSSGAATVYLSAAQSGGGIATGGGGGGGGGGSFTLQEADDNSIAHGQTADAVIALMYRTNGSNQVRWDGAVSQSGTWNITNISGTVSLPTGAATESTLSSLNGKVTAVNTGAVVISTFPDNEPFNVAQINGVTPLMGAGNTGTGSMRMTIATDQAALAGMGVGATGSAVPANSNYIGVNVGGTNRGVTGLAVGSAFAPTVAIVDSSGNQISSFGGSGGTAMADDGGFTVGTTSVTPIAGIYRSSRDTVNDNDAGALAMTANRGLFAVLETVNGDAVVDETADAVKSLLVDAAGAALTEAAHDAPDGGSPVKIGFRATSSIIGQAPVANNDRTDAYAGLDGVQIIRQHANLEDRMSGVAAVTDGSSTSLVAAQGSGVRFCATTLIVSNSSATNVTVDIRDGTAGSVIATIPAAANMGGAVIPLAVPLCTTANTAMAADPSASASTVTTTAIGFRTEL